jgi:hypothetical protein
VDREAVKALKAQVREELAREEAGRVVDNSGDEAVFIAEARGYAESDGITVGAFQAMGVSDDVLQQAGFEVPAGGRTPSSGAGGRRRSGGTRAPRIPIEEVLVAAKGLPAQWKLADLAGKLERDATTVRNYVRKLMDEGAVVEVGDDPEHDGRGRAAKVYRVE